MSKIHFTSDLHFFHNNILSYCPNRPWNTIEEMNEGLILNWNEVVSPHDSVYILGDVAMGGKKRASELAEILDRLNGKKYLVPGNHDTYILEDEECRSKFTLLPPLYELGIRDSTLPKSGERLRKQTIILCHFSLRVWHKNGRGSWHLYGHSHGSLNDFGKSFDVGIDSPHSNFRPMSYEQIREIMNSKEFIALDHHDSQTNYN